MSGNKEGTKIAASATGAALGTELSCYTSDISFWNFISGVPLAPKTLFAIFVDIT